MKATPVLLFLSPLRQPVVELIVAIWSGGWTALSLMLAAIFLLLMAPAFLRVTDADVAV